MATAGTEGERNRGTKWRRDWRRPGVMEDGEAEKVVDVPNLDRDVFLPKRNFFKL